MSSSSPPPEPPESVPPPRAVEGLPPPLRRHRKGGRPWGPTRVLVGLLAVVFIALLEAGVVIAIAPPPPFEPVAVATASPDAEDLFVLNADGDTAWVMDANGSDALDHAATVPVPAESAFLAAGPDAHGGSVLAVAGRNDKDVTLISYAHDGGSQRLRTLPINRPEACTGAIRKQQCTGVRSLAVGDIGPGGRPALAVGTLGGQVRIFDLAGANRLQRTITIKGNHRIVEALAIGRLDADPHADLLVRARGGVVPYLGSPSGALRPLEDRRLPEIAQSLAIGELGPGNVALAPLGSDQVQVLSWDEQAGFVHDRDVDLGDGVRSVAVAGVFGGRPQLAAATDDEHVSVLRAHDDGSFHTVADFESQQPLAARILLQALLAVTLIGVAFAVANPGSGLASPWALGLRRWTRSPFRPAALAYLSYIACALLIAAFIHPEQENVTRDLGFGESAVGDVASAVLIVAVAPLSEEVFFRGFMFAGLRRRLPFLLAALVSACVWGLFHFTGPGSWGVVLQLSIFGIVLAWLYERTGSIWPTIAVHALNNALAFTLLTS